MSHQWVDNTCKRCALVRRRVMSMGHTKFWMYYRNGKPVGRAGRCSVAAAFPCCGGSDEHPPKHTQDCPDQAVTS